LSRFGNKKFKHIKNSYSKAIFLKWACLECSSAQINAERCKFSKYDCYKGPSIKINWKKSRNWLPLLCPH